MSKNSNDKVEINEATTSDKKTTPIEDVKLKIELKKLEIEETKLRMLLEKDTNMKPNNESWRYAEESTQQFYYVSKNKLVDVETDTYVESDDWTILNKMEANAPSDCKNPKAAIKKTLALKPIWKHDGINSSDQTQILTMFGKDNMYITRNLNTSLYLRLRESQQPLNKNLVEKVKENFKTYLNTLLKPETVDYVGWWFGYQVLRPTVKTGISLCVFDEGGHGKSFLGELVKIAIQGQILNGNVCVVGTGQDINNQFGGGRIAGHTLVIIDECYVQGHGFMNFLKTAISSDELECTQKGKDGRRVRWYGDWYLTSNHENPLKFEKKNRKFYLTKTAEVTPIDAIEFFIWMKDNGYYNEIAFGVGEVLAEFVERGDKELGFRVHKAPLTEEGQRIVDIMDIDNNAETNSSIDDYLETHDVYRLEDIRDNISWFGCDIHENQRLRYIGKYISDNHKGNSFKMTYLKAFRSRDKDMTQKAKEMGFPSKYTMYVNKRWLDESNVSVNYDQSTKVYLPEHNANGVINKMLRDYFINDGASSLSDDNDEF